MKLMARSPQPFSSSTPPRAVDTARQGLNATIWIPEAVTLQPLHAVKNLETLEIFSGFSQYQYNHLNKTPANLGMLLLWIDQLWKASVYGLKRFEFEENIKDPTSAEFRFVQFALAFPNFQDPVVKIRKPLFTRNPQQVTMKMNSRSESKLGRIALAFDAILEPQPEVEVLRVKGGVTKPSKKASLVLELIEFALHEKLRSSEIARMEFLDSEGNIIPPPQLQ